MKMARGQVWRIPNLFRYQANAIGEFLKRAEIRTGITPGGLPDLSPYGVEKGKFVGKTWGELPGELRTRIVQDMKAKYGDDYARMIKLYFEQIAATSPRANPPPDASEPRRK